ncbi:hypothetical protein, partial [Streptomyces albidoflavus]|uniref:hypothetical protein n=1 Tax=Streptomyces albidoflavus TaxID=1886 RepID=UPI001C3ED99F
MGPVAARAAPPARTGEPGKWVIDIVYNKGIVKLWNLAAKVLPIATTRTRSRLTRRPSSRTTSATGSPEASEPETTTEPQQDHGRDAGALRPVEAAP